MRPGSVITLTFFAAAVFAVSATVASELPRQWQVTADGREGELVVQDETQGRIEATLFARPATGFRAGALVVLQREVDGSVELWQGRLGRRPDGAAFLSGTISNGTAVAPFFAVERLEKLLPSTPSAIDDHGPEPASPSGAPSAPTPQPPRSGFEGPWSTPEGVAMVVRDGSSIEVTMPAGAVCAGRMTSDTTFVVGLRVACCKGKLEGPDTIRWSDTTVWKREQ